MSRRATLRMTAILVVLVGLVFIGHGLGVIRNRSFMVDDVRWAVVGAVMIVGALALATWDRTRRR
jgi:prepilin signal peptidase PulO-like enzyme (type II secretory pathway)